MQRGGSKSNFFVVPANAGYGLRPGDVQHHPIDMTDSPRRTTTVQTLRGPNARGSPHPYRAANRNGGDGQRSRCHTPDDFLGSGFARPQSIHDVQHNSTSGYLFKNI